MKYSVFILVIETLAILLINKSFKSISIGMKNNSTFLTKVIAFKIMDDSHQDFRELN